MIDGQYRKLGYYDTQADNLTWLNMEEWSGGKVSFVNKQKPHFVNYIKTFTRDEKGLGENLYHNIFILILLAFANVELTLILFLENTFHFCDVFVSISSSFFFFAFCLINRD